MASLSQNSDCRSSPSTPLQTLALRFAQKMIFSLLCIVFKVRAMQNSFHFASSAVVSEAFSALSRGDIYVLYRFFPLLSTPFTAKICFITHFCILDQIGAKKPNVVGCASAIARENAAIAWGMAHFHSPLFLPCHPGRAAAPGVLLTVSLH